ncbi:PP2C family protein-serine/threonine phosphatase [Micromonospora sp. DSM 115977]|uniref:PP2C family protein-serine/threonine phosphatase n=1 Tax=Micromonospora reichwaldensis TaxID=3075516 RepID=A0ABU2WVN7_9ACTN|nr:PP2C family protein-serine/threonine phosphatase [Micromonospora sp. DSM 115977]MDT0529941.1 PP2C family protein-serine/threonine phosphatase [Micromonospora sp. DSM 115977]
MTTVPGGGGPRPADGGQPARLRSGLSPGPARPVDSRLTREVLDGLTEAVVTTDRAGLVTLVNAMATALLPELVPGTDLRACPIPAMARAAGAGADSFDAEHGGRRLRGVRRDLADGRHAWYVRDVTEEHTRTEALSVERSRTTFLAQAGSRLGLSLQREQTLRTATTLPVPYLADLAMVVHLPPPPAEGQPHWIRYDGVDPALATGLATWSLTDSLPGLAEALAGHAANPAPWPDQEAAGLSTVLPPGFGRPGTVLVSPMRGAGRTTGALVLVRRAGRAGFARRDIELAREFAARAGAALGAAELYGEQVHLARVLQNSLLPPDLPAVPGATLAGGYRAAGDRLRIGGDFYDVFPIPRGAIFALGDVAGKGVGAAVLTGRVRQSLRTLRLVEQRPLELMRLLNQALFDSPDAARRSQFTTLLLGTLHAAPGGGCTVRIAGGGHPSPLLVRADGGVAPVAVGGMPVGALAAARFAEAELCLGPGELLLAYTDGVVEARGGPGGQEMFGEERLRAALASAAGLAPAALVDRLLDAVDEWLDGQSQDDIAMLAVAAAAP